jgi:hypothetical protein
MKFSKIRERLKECWTNDCISGKFGSNDMAEDISFGLDPSATKEDWDFWYDLRYEGLEECTKKYPELFNDSRDSSTSLNNYLTTTKERAQKALDNRVEKSIDYSTHTTKQQTRGNTMIKIELKTDLRNPNMYHVSYSTPEGIEFEPSDELISKKLHRFVFDNDEVKEVVAIIERDYGQALNNKANKERLHAEFLKELSGAYPNSSITLIDKSIDFIRTVQQD